MRLFKMFSAIAAALGLVLAFNAQAEQHQNQMQKSDIVETAKASGEFNTFTKALKASGLADEMKKGGPYTVFAPTDAAFEKLGEKKVNDLLKPANKEELRTLLKHHVISGKVKSGELAGKQINAETLEGDKIAIDGTKGVKVEKATVTMADIEASNGVIHGVDKVLKK